MKAPTPAPLRPLQPRTAKSSSGVKHGESHQFIDPSERPSAQACGDLATALAAQAGTSAKDARWADQLWLMVAVAASCGVRQGELLDLRVRQLSFSAALLHVDRQLIRVSGTPAHSAAPKWGRRRTTILPELTLWGDPLAARLEAFVAGRPADALVFPSRRGSWIHASNFGKRDLMPARQAAPRWQEAWSWHSLRHAFCSHLLVEGALDTDVALAAGHRDTSVTRAMYVGATAGALTRLNDRMRSTAS